MNCPNCQTDFGTDLPLDDIPELSPVLCEKCEKICILDGLRLREIKPSEVLEWKDNPGYQHLLHIQSQLYFIKRSKRAILN